jgi:hypothetical protein
MACDAVQNLHPLIAAGAPEDKARAPAEEVDEYQREFSAIDTRLARIETKLDTVATRTWILTAMLTQTFALLGGMAALIRLIPRAH